MSNLKREKLRSAWIEFAAACLVIALGVAVVILLRAGQIGAFATLGNEAPPSWMAPLLVISAFFLLNSLKIAGIVVLATAVLGLLVRKGQSKNATWIFSWKRFSISLLALFFVPLIYAILFFPVIGPPRDLVK